MATGDKIRVGIVGAGGNTRQRHIPGFQAIPGVEVTVVCNRSEESSRKAAQECGIPRIARSWVEVVEDPEVDAVCIGTWPYLHADVSIAALDNGKHVLTEARMARNAREAEAMVDALQRNKGRVAQIVPSPYTLDYDAKVREILGSGQLGTLRAIEVVQTGGMYARADAPLTWRQSARLSGENMLTLGIFYEPLQRWLDADPASLRAVGTVFTPERRNEAGDTEPVLIPEQVTVLATYADGPLLHAHFSGIESGRGRSEFILNGTDATLRIDVGQGKLFLAKAGSKGEEEIAIPDGQRRGWRVEADFIDSIRNGTPVRLTSFGQGLRYMRFTEAVWKSWSTGGEIACVGDAPADPGL